ncbi:MAG: dihydrofolate reductase [Gemmatimonadota bacterium]|nr:dihydrofolate reductase [Gemmatimonadota bacterium]
MILSLIAAMAENRTIGRDGALPWHLPRDMRRFKEITMGHAVIMGRKTYESMDKPLPGRRNLVLTRRRDYRSAGIEVFPTLDAALDAASGDLEVFVAGGEQIYRLALPRADRIYLTMVHRPFDGDAVFPEFELDDWHLEEDVRYEPDALHLHAHSFLLYSRAARSTRRRQRPSGTS